MRGVKKTNLPQKTCLVCQRPFTWRKKWETVWDEVKYCSERCRRSRSQTVTKTASKSTPNTPSKPTPKTKTTSSNKK